MRRDIPPSSSWDLGDVAVGVQALEHACHAGSVASCLGGIGCLAEEDFPDLTVTEARDDVLAAHDGGDESGVVRNGGTGPQDYERPARARGNQMYYGL